ncbi:hypothetical protein D3C81_1308970 [compost metagenome]
MRAIVYALAALGQQAPLRQVEHQTHHVRRAVDDGGVDHSALAGGASIEDTGENADRQIQGAATDVAQRADRRGRSLTGGAAVIHGAGQRDVVVVMTSSHGHRAALAPAGHAAEYQLRIARQQHIRAKAQTFHHARTHTFDQRIGAFDQLQHGFAAFGGLQIGDHRALATVHRILRGIRLTGDRRGLAALDGDDIRAEVGQMHGTEGTRTDPANFDDLDT